MRDEINVNDRVVMTYIGGLFHDLNDYREGTVQSKCRSVKDGELFLTVKWDDGIITSDNGYTVRKKQ